MGRHKRRRNEFKDQYLELKALDLEFPKLQYICSYLDYQG